MVSSINQLEDTLENAYKSTPKLPENARKTLVDLSPWLSLVAGVLMLAAALSIWNWVHLTTGLVNYANSLSAIYGTAPVVTNEWSLMLWISFFILLGEAIFYLLAFPGLRAKQKRGWDMLFYAVLLNVAYGIFVAFTAYGGVSTFIGTVLGAAIALYFLYQVRGLYPAVKAKK